MTLQSKVEESKMAIVKRFVILRRKPGMTVDEFWNYWQNVHGPLVAKIPGIMRYFQYHVRSDHLDGSDRAIDGIAELWFESEEAQKKAWATPEYQAVVADEPNLFKLDSHHIHPVMTEKIVEII
jgi:uncharacterized protein (TIGR02118 family)